MTRSRYLSVLALTVAAAACSADRSPTAPLTQSDEDAVGTLLVSMTGGDPTADRRGGNSLFDRLAAEIDGFGGLYRNGPCAVAVVLTDMSEAAHAVEVVKAALEPLAACPDGIRVHPVEGQFTYQQLVHFHRSSQQLLRIDGVRAVTINYKLNRLVVHVARRSVAQQVIEALTPLDIPQAAVVFQLSGATSGRG